MKWAQKHDCSLIITLKIHKIVYLATKLLFCFSIYLGRDVTIHIRAVLAPNDYSGMRSTGAPEPVPNE